MSVVDTLLDPIRRLGLARTFELRPSWPPVAVELDRGELTLVRVRARRRGKPSLEAHAVRALPPRSVGASIFRPNLAEPEDLAARLRELFEATGTRPGRVSLVLPDNLAKISIVTLPDRPASRKQLAEVLRFKLRRSVPFRLEDAVLSWQVLPDGGGKETTLLVAVMLRGVVEQYESVLESLGARPGLVDLCTPSLYNLYRHEIETASATGEDVALFNAARTYFTLLIARQGRPIFFRCKTLVSTEDEDLGPVASEGALSRELVSSLSYYQEKLDGHGIGTVFVRSVAEPVEKMAEILDRAGFGTAVPVDPVSALGLGEGIRIEPSMGQRIAPSLGAATGRVS